MPENKIKETGILMFFTLSYLENFVKYKNNISPCSNTYKVYVKLKQRP